MALEDRLVSHSPKNAQVPNKTFVPRKRASLCNICKAGDQVIALANRMLVNGATVKDTTETLSPLMSALGYKVTDSTVRTHKNKHLPYVQGALRKIAEKNALLEQKDIEQGEENILTAAGYVEAMMVKGFENLQDENTTVSPKDGLAAAQVYAEIQAQAAQAEDALELRSQLNRIIAVVNEVVSEEQRVMIASMLQGNRPAVESAESQTVQSYRDMPNPNHRTTT